MAKPTTTDKKSPAASNKKNIKNDNNNNKKPFNKKDNNNNKEPMEDKKVVQKTKLTKREKREEKFEKKAKFDTNFTLVRELKLLWVKIKEIKLSTEERAVLVEQLTQKLKGNVLNVVVKHDASRIVQTLLKYGDEKQKSIIYKELKDHEIVISKSQYGRFLILKLLKYGNEEQRNSIIKAYNGKYLQLLSHKESASVVEYIYSEIASKLQKTQIVEEFYGPEYRLFKTDTPRTLDTILETSPQKKESIITFLSAQLTKILSSKGERLVQYTIVQHLLLDLFRHSKPDTCTDMSETLSEILLPMIHTKEGAQVAYHVVSYGSPKTRKTIIKTLKDFFTKVACEEYGYLALIRLLDVTDDTQMIIKSVFSELIPTLPETSITKQGCLWILHILTPYSPQNFTEQTLSLLTPTMKSSVGIEHSISKKDREQRRKELLNFISPKLVELCSSHTEDLLSSQWGTKVLNATLKFADGNKMILMKKVLEVLTEEFLEEQHINVQTLLRNDHIKTTDLPLQLLEKFNWIELCLKNQNTVYIYRDLLKSLPNDSKEKVKAQADLKKSKSKLESTKFKGIENLFNLKDEIELQEHKQPQQAETTKKTSMAKQKSIKKVEESDNEGDDSEEEKVIEEKKPVAKKVAKTTTTISTKKSLTKK
ncbi:hypothetical protein DICPUDRAFT_155553 [Dictyostelium purpureum]|uniref:PUM-HD domain-containing protein n=1 Tax=Dictyostelium purpureum TaxID=5786 RepID=F0ZUB2_DICPU|nr:uncharacterized protein DICPUDRAFT_155553 [Dictyostelium purpureum]EGC32475.1 hypothetical protein DICPUDRAFT_155553 [Dictyostelium purpureum]|eukprot:XP_003291009.1 hypothetical protein DICPUDRAFT_155553 [Dictyostelium purpureum]